MYQINKIIPKLQYLTNLNAKFYLSPNKTKLSQSNIMIKKYNIKISSSFICHVEIIKLDKKNMH